MNSWLVWSQRMSVNVSWFTPAIKKNRSSAAARPLSTAGAWRRIAASGCGPCCGQRLRSNRSMLLKRSGEGSSWYSPGIVESTSETSSLAL